MSAAGDFRFRPGYPFKYLNIPTRTAFSPTEFMQRYENMLAILRHERVKDIRAKGCYISLGSEANRGILKWPPANFILTVKSARACGGAFR